MCGDCTEYCKWMPGEEHEYPVNKRITTCYDRSKGNYKDHLQRQAAKKQNTVKKVEAEHELEAALND